MHKSSKLVKVGKPKLLLSSNHSWLARTQFHRQSTKNYAQIARMQVHWMDKPDVSKRLNPTSRHTLLDLRMATNQRSTTSCQVTKRKRFAVSPKHRQCSTVTSSAKSSDTKAPMVIPRLRTALRVRTWICEYDSKLDSAFVCTRTHLSEHSKPPEEDYN